MYTRFFRWASDRIKDEGIVAFVTNRSFIDARTMDGFRKLAMRDFSDIMILDLGGDVRANPKLSGSKHNVFGIQTGVAISFLVRRKNQDGKGRLYYARRPELETAEEKLAFLSSHAVSSIHFDEITPDAKANWLGQTANDFESLIPVATKETKAAKVPGQERAIFKLYSLGVSTNRDEWVYDFDETNLERKIELFLEIFKSTAFGSKTNSIKWSETLNRKRGALRDKIDFDIKNISSAIYRPYNIKKLYFDRNLIDRPGEISNYIESLNEIIAMSGPSSSKGFNVLGITNIGSLDLLEKTQTLPLYRYTPSGERIDNITDWALGQFQTAYVDPALRVT
jgi:predicted helicase